MNRAKAEAIISDALDLLDRKNADYGSDNISATGIYGVAVRLTDKVHRLLNLTKPNGAPPNFESVGDTFLDVLNYGIIGKLLMDGTWDGDVPTFSNYGENEIPSVYLAGSIDAVDEDYARGWRENASAILCSFGVSTYDPTAPFSPSRNGWSKGMMRQVNRAAIAACDGFLVNLTDSKGFGTHREIEFAASLGKTIVVWGNRAELDKKVEAYDLTLIYPDLDNCALVLAKELGCL